MSAIIMMSSKYLYTVALDCYNHCGEHSIVLNGE